MASDTEQDKPDSSIPKYRIGLVARLTGISAHQLRIWERRYQTVTPKRSQGGDRLYSDDDVAKLRILKQLSDQGHSIGQVARLSSEELAALLQATPEERQVHDDSLLGQRVSEQFLDRIKHMDLLGAERTLGRASVAFEPRTFVLDVILPILREVGERWARGDFSVAQEHAASSVLRTQLGGLMRLYTPELGAKVVVCATLAHEHHELGALAAALTAASRGWRVIYLGPNLPTAEIARTVQTARAELLLISMVVFRAQVRDELQQLKEQLPERVRLIVGGAATDKLTALPEGCEIMDSIEALDAIL